MTKMAYGRRVVSVRTGGALPDGRIDSDTPSLALPRGAGEGSPRAATAKGPG